MNVKRQRPDGERAGGRGPRTPKAEQSEATRAALLETARRLFAERGYAAVGTEEIVRATGVTRGALYHHFAGKEALFQAVYEEVEQQLVQQIATTVLSSAGEDPLAALRVGAEAFLDACEDPAVQRIALVDAPSVLGWERWREIGLRYALGLVQGTIQAAIDAGRIEPQPIDPLAHLLLGAIDEGAMLIARADDGAATRAQVGQALGRFLDALAAS
ncbi:MAG TPA: TetR/AcrR family transcriptional regulator [Solirubrobacteraceae bacterium]|nr:TetR/AcrR family transcriptional regulator [Solirubrobacteraceae bacterium]